MASQTVPAVTTANNPAPAPAPAVNAARAKNKAPKKKGQKEDEIKLPGQPAWTKTPEETKFLTDRYISFVSNQRANDTEAATNFWISLYRDFFKKWPIGTPSAEILAAFSGDGQKAKAAMKKDKEHKIYMWYYNHQRAENVGTLRTSGATQIPTTAPRMLSATRMYTKLFYEEKVRAEVIRRWKLQDHGGDGPVVDDPVVDAGSAQEDDDEDGADEDKETVGIPVNFKMRVAEELLAAESPEIKQFVDTTRREAVKAIDDLTNEDEEERVRRLGDFASAITGISKPCQNFLKNLTRKSGWHGMMVVGGPDPSNGGKIRLFSYTSGSIAEYDQDFRSHYPDWTPFMQGYLAYLKLAFPQEVRDARALPAPTPTVISLIDSDEDSIPEAPPIQPPQPAPRKRGRPHKTSYRNTEALYPQSSSVTKPQKKAVTFGLDPLLKDAISFDDEGSDIQGSASAGTAPKPLKKKGKKSSTPKATSVSSLGPQSTHAVSPAPAANLPDPSPSAPGLQIHSLPAPKPQVSFPPVPESRIPSPPAPPRIPSPPVPVPIPEPQIPSQPTPKPRALSPPAPVPILEPQVSSPPRIPSPPAPVVKSKASKKKSLIDKLVMPSWLCDALKHLEKIEGDDTWVGLIKSFVDFERFKGFERGGGEWVDVQICPAEFSCWQVPMKHPPALAPPIDDFKDFLHRLRIWWISLQPIERGEGLLRLSKGLEWKQLNIGGPFGMFSFIISLSWCLEALGTVPEFMVLVDDVMWVLKELVNVEEAPTSTRRSGRGAVAPPATAPRGTKRPAEATTSQRKRAKK